MASKVRKALNSMNKYNYEPGAMMLHAADATTKQGKRDKIRNALHKQRLRTTGGDVK